MKEQINKKLSFRKECTYDKESTCNAGDPGWGLEDPLETGMATLCSVLAWEIAWTEEPSGLVYGVAQNWT